MWIGTQTQKKFTHIRRNEQAKGIDAQFSYEMDVRFIDPITSPTLNYKLGFWMGTHIKTTKQALRIM